MYLFVQDLYRILTEPETNMIRQQQLLMKTEDIHLVFTDEAIEELAAVAAEVRPFSQKLKLSSSNLYFKFHTIVLNWWIYIGFFELLQMNCSPHVLLLQVNRSVDNIGARRLHTVSVLRCSMCKLPIRAYKL